MSSITNVHPDAVLDSLLAKPCRANVSRTLRALHDICQKEHAAGLRNISVANIGRKADAAGLLSYRSLYNSTSHVYRDLINAWATYCGPPIPSPAKPLASNEYLLKIPDPAIRMIMQGIIAERDTLKAQINLLKASCIGSIDRRPLGISLVSDPKVGPSAILMPAAQLNELEREALRAAISTNFLDGEGWEEGDRGEIKKGKRLLFRHGFTSAIRKVLQESPH